MVVAPDALPGRRVGPHQAIPGLGPPGPQVPPRGSPRGVDGSGVPKGKARPARPRARARRAASTARSIPFDHSMRATSATCSGGGGGSGAGRGRPGRRRRRRRSSRARLGRVEVEEARVVRVLEQVAGRAASRAAADQEARAAGRARSPAQVGAGPEEAEPVKAKIRRETPAIAAAKPPIRMRPQGDAMNEVGPLGLEDRRQLPGRVARRNQVQAAAGPPRAGSPARRPSRSRPGARAGG